MPLVALVYISFATYRMTDDELRDILEISRKNNQEKNITGMLLYRDGFFIQALEGEEAEVEALYQKIRDDKRHRSVTMVYKNRISQRGFGEWSMGFNKLSDEDVSQVPGFTDFLQKSDNTEFILNHPGRAARLLETFKHKTYF